MEKSGPIVGVMNFLAILIVRKECRAMHHLRAFSIARW